jgi:Type III restriction enzyme, res subunit
MPSPRHGSVDGGVLWLCWRRAWGRHGWRLLMSTPFRRERERMPRVLFLAHRSELLEQAADTFRCMFREARFSWFAGDRAALEGDIVFASVQKLSAPANLDRLEGEIGPALDYVVVDEVHHATAPSYRRILDRLERPFVLASRRHPTGRMKLTSRDCSTTIWSIEQTWVKESQRGSWPPLHTSASAMSSTTRTFPGETVTSIPTCWYKPSRPRHGWSGYGRPDSGILATDRSYSAARLPTRSTCATGSRSGACVSLQCILAATRWIGGSHSKP